MTLHCTRVSSRPHRIFIRECIMVDITLPLFPRQYRISQFSAIALSEQRCTRHMKCSRAGPLPRGLLSTRSPWENIKKPRSTTILIPLSPKQDEFKFVITTLIDGVEGSHTPDLPGRNFKLPRDLITEQPNQGSTCCIYRSRHCKHGVTTERRRCYSQY